ncbi:MAG: hypothetical protein ABI574_04615 [Burkholderiales bacterium]
MSGTPRQATSGECWFRDPAVDPPPAGVSMLLLNPGGVMVVGVWTDSAVAWAPKPKVPAAVKARLLRAATGVHRDNRSR